MIELLQLIPMVADHFYNPITGSLSIEINGVGSRYDWLEIFRTIVAVIIGILKELAASHRNRVEFFKK